MREAGYQLDRVQHGLMPHDWKPMPSVGQGVYAIRVWDESDTFRVIYLARLVEAIYVLHCLHKKTQQTQKREIDIAAQRYRDLPRPA